MTYITNGLNLARRQDIEGALVPACKAAVEDSSSLGSPCRSCVHGFILMVLILFFFFFFSSSPLPLKALPFQVIFTFLESRLLIGWSCPLSQRKAANQSRTLPCVPVETSEIVMDVKERLQAEFPGAVLESALSRAK